MNNISLQGKRAVITGAGRGIGRAYALDFAKRGAAVVVNDYNKDAAEEVVSEIRAIGGTAVANGDTVATVDGGAAIIRSAADSFDGVDIVVNNAGFLRPAYFGDLSFDQINAVIEAHLLGAFHVTQPAWRLMTRQGYGRIVMTSSSSGLFAHHATANYSAAKAGIYGLTRALAYEGKPFGIRVNAVLPMAATTIAVDNAIPDMLEHRARVIGEEMLARIANRPRGPEMVAPMVSYLASEECAVTGEAFSVCCGRYARVFVGVADGWMAGAETSAEDIRDNLEAIRDTSSFSIPQSLFDEYARVAGAL